MFGYRFFYIDPIDKNNSEIKYYCYNKKTKGISSRSEQGIKFFVEDFLNLVHQVAFVRLQCLLDFLHQINDKGERDTLCLDYLLIVHQLHLLHLLEGLVFTLVELEQQIFTH